MGLTFDSFEKGVTMKLKHSRYMLHTLAIFVLALFVASLNGRKLYSIGLNVKKVHPSTVHSFPKGVRERIMKHRANLPITNMVFGPLVLGSNNQEMIVMYDTGSTILWVNDKSNCESCSESFGMRDGFNCQASSTCEKTSTIQDLEYGLGTTHGYEVYDSVKLNDDLLAVHHPFVVALSVTDSDDMQGVNGICGLSSTSGKKFSIMESLKSQGKIQEKVFSFLISDDENVPSTLVIGGVDPELLDPLKPFYRLELKNVGHQWTTSLDAVEIGVSHKRVLNGHEFGLFDTGTSHLVFSTEVVDRIIAANKEAGIDCEMRGQFEFICLIPTHILTKYERKSEENILRMASEVLPQIHFQIGNEEFSLEGEHLIASYEEVNQGALCGLLIAAGDYGVHILGDPMFRKYYTVFYEDGHQIILFHARRRKVSRRITIGGFSLETKQNISFLKE
eukprot:TRINITY_DN3815_c0_g1_i2.p1 TRINITY_DN3815_c0_g1~~TRINITY_DN3815_c0_g1_i2.p1  ORF type:complete len:460 (-),score=82.63 TRINITY_DN3815_c0_g1_i2:77-1420(-)